MKFLRQILTGMLVPNGKMAFVDRIPNNGKLLDVGCGNNSPLIIKSRRPDIHYSGIDVGEYNQSIDINKYADEYIVTSPERFASEIARFEGTFDVVMSSHNMEHCDSPDEVLAAMLKAMKIGGRLYLAFPCEASARFPRRLGCLNFFDDATHKNLLDYDKTLKTISENGCMVEFSVRRYRPVILCCIGFLLEPLSKMLKKNMPYNSTWSYYGFETVIWAKRVS